MLWFFIYLGDIVSECTSHSPNIKALKQYEAHVLFFNWFDTGISFKDLELIYSRWFKMKQQKTYRRSNVYVGYMRGTFVYDDFLHLFGIPNNLFLLFVYLTLREVMASQSMTYQLYIPSCSSLQRPSDCLHSLFARKSSDSQCSITDICQSTPSGNLSTDEADGALNSCR